MVYKPRRERRRGGKAEEPLHLESGNKYNAVGSPEAKEEDEKSDGFNRGGMAKKHKKKEGGKVEGHAAKHHLGKRARGGGMMAKEIKEEKAEKHEPDGEMPERARGGHVHHKEHHKRARGGGAPFSEGHKQAKAPDDDKDTGPGERAPTIP
jgi:hypothetical protein